MASSSSSPSDPAPPPPPLLLPPPEPAPAPAPAPPAEARSKPNPTVADNVRGLLRSGEAFIRGAFRGSSGNPTPPRPPPPPQQQHNRPAGIMERFQRDTFPEVMKLLDKHEQMERIFSMYRSGKGFHFPDLPIRVKVALDAVGALFLVDDSEFEQARQTLDRAGIRTGLSSRFVLEAKTRGRDTIAAELSTRFEAGARLGEATGRPLELTRLQYCTHINDWLSMILVPFGAQCSNFLHDSSLIQNPRSQACVDGPPSFSEHHNCAAGLSIKGSKFTASIAELIYGSGAQDSGHGVANRMTTFGQVSYEPALDVKLSLSGLWQICPSSSRFNNLGTLAVPLGSLKPHKRTPPQAPDPGLTERVQLPAPPAPAPTVSIGSPVMVQGPPAPERVQLPAPPAPAPTVSIRSPVMVQGPPAPERVQLPAPPAPAPTVSIRSPVMVQGPPAPERVQLPAPPAPAPTVSIRSPVMVQGPPAPALPAGTASETRSAQSIAAMLGCELYGSIKAEGWVQMERPNRGPLYWGFCLSDTPDYELGWGVRMGGTAAGEKHHPHLEGFLSLNIGKGAKLQPGLVFVMEGAKPTPALALRSSWSM